GLLSPRTGHGRPRRVVGVRENPDSAGAQAGQRYLADARRDRIGVRADAARAERVEVDAAEALGEVDVRPAAGDVPEQLMPRDELTVGDRRDDVPVAEYVVRSRLNGDRRGRA